MSMTFTASSVDPNGPVLSPELLRGSGALLSPEQLRKAKQCEKCDADLTIGEEMYLDGTCSDCEKEWWGY